MVGLAGSQSRCSNETRVPSPFGLLVNSQTTRVPAHVGGKPLVAQTTRRSVDSSSTSSNGLGAPGNVSRRTSPTAAGTEARSVHQPLIPTSLVRASTTSRSPALTSNSKTTSRVAMGHLLTILPAALPPPRAGEGWGEGERPLLQCWL